MTQDNSLSSGGPKKLEGWAPLNLRIFHSLLFGGYRSFSKGQLHNLMSWLSFNYFRSFQLPEGPICSEFCMEDCAISNAGQACTPLQAGSPPEHAWLCIFLGLLEGTWVLCAHSAARKDVCIGTAQNTKDSTAAIQRTKALITSAARV